MRHTRSKSASERRERQWEQQESVVSERERERERGTDSCVWHHLCFVLLFVVVFPVSLCLLSLRRGRRRQPGPKISGPKIISQFQIPEIKSQFVGLKPRSQFQLSISDPKTQVPKVYVGHTFRSQNSGPQSVGHKLRSQNIGLELRSQKICLNFRSQISGANFISYFLFRYKMHPTQKPPPKLRSQIQIPRFRLCFSGKPTWIPKFRSQSQFMCLGAIHSGPQIQVPISNQNIYQVSKFRSQNAGANFRSCLSTST
jgi:hypothetical protein